MRLFKVGGFVLLAMLVLWVSYWLGTQHPSADAQKTTLTQPTFTKTFNKDFHFPIKDASGNTVATLSYDIVSLQLQDQIIVAGQKANAVTGRTFCIINLKLTNTSNQAIQVNTKDFVRISLNKQADLLAPEIHNDPVTIQPISTKLTRLGLPIDTTTKEVVLHIGQIQGPKDTITIQLPH